MIYKSCPILFKKRYKLTITSFALRIQTNQSFILYLREKRQYQVTIFNLETAIKIHHGEMPFTYFHPLKHFLLILFLQRFVLLKYSFSRSEYERHQCFDFRNKTFSFQFCHFVLFQHFES